MQKFCTNSVGSRLHPSLGFFLTVSWFFQGAVSGVLLVTPNNIMFDPHRMDPMVQAHGCEEYGIMCPLEEVQSAAIYKEITDPKIRETVPE